jgi:signal transduction histidine kinase
MNAVIALTDLLLQERYSLNDEQAEHLEVIQTSGNHLLTVSAAQQIYTFCRFY